MNPRMVRATLALLLVCSCAGEGLAQVCCPKDCVQKDNGCVTTGANPLVCNRVPCSPSPTGSGGGGGGGGHRAVTPPNTAPGPECVTIPKKQAKIDEATNQCVASLVANAQLIGCLFESDEGKAEDKRTGLTCPERQAALARQCRARCATFAEISTTRFCPGERYIDTQWQDTFGDLGGQMVGSARVEGCGPPLKTAIRANPAALNQKTNRYSTKP